MITGTDRSVLQLRHTAFKMAKHQLRWSNTHGVNKGPAMAQYNRTKARLRRQCKEVAAKLWPETGRPREIKWRVAPRPGRSYMAVHFKGPYKACDEFIKKSRMELVWEVVPCET